MANLTITLVLTDGSVDQAASTQAFQAEMLNYIAARETEQATIAEAVSAVFDQFKGSRIAMPALASLTLAKLNVQPENYSVLSERVLGYVRENAAPGGLFVIGKGKNGGVARVSDLPAPAAK